jgi:hypothetical protein
MISRRGIFGMFAGGVALLTGRAAAAKPAHPVDVLKAYWPEMSPEYEAEARALCDQPAFTEIRPTNLRFSVRPVRDARVLIAHGQVPELGAAVALSVNGCAATHRVVNVEPVEAGHWITLAEIPAQD